MADSHRLPVVETFHSLQGEGHHAGRSAFFIRLAGCTVGCPWCDTKHSWPVQGHAEQPINALADAAQMAAAAGASFVVITGGEPLHHDLQPLTQALDARCGLPLHLETSGVDPLSGRFDWITLSPKRHRPPRQELLQLQKLLPWGAVAFRREGDPVEASAQRIHPAGFQMQGETASRIEGLGEGLQIVMQRFSTGDHNEAGPRCGSHLGGISQGIDGLLSMPLDRP